MARLSPALGLGPIREKLLAHPFGPSVDGLCPLILFGGEADHVHLVISIHPAFSILINTLKSSSSRRMRNRFADDHLAKFYGETVFLAPRLLRRECRRSIFRDGKTLCRGLKGERQTSPGGQETAPLVIEGNPRRA